MGICTSTEQTAKFSLNVIKYAFKNLKEQVEYQTKRLQQFKQCQQKQLKKIQTVKRIIKSLDEQIGYFYQQFREQKKPTDFIYSIDKICSLLDDIWADHRMSLSKIKETSQHVEFQRKAAKNVKQNQQEIGKNTFIDLTIDTNKKDSHDIDTKAQIDALNTKIQSLQQNQKNIDELNFQLAIDNSRLKNGGNLTDKEKQYIKRIEKHQLKFVELQKKLGEKFRKQEQLNQKIKTIEQEKNKLQKRIKEIEQTTNPTPYPQQFLIYNPDQQLKAENESLVKRLRQTKEQLSLMIKERQNYSLSAVNPSFRSSQNQSLAIKRSKQEIQELQLSKQKLQNQVKQKEQEIVNLKSNISKLKGQLNTLSIAKRDAELQLSQRKQFMQPLKAIKSFQTDISVKSKNGSLDFSQREVEIQRKTNQIAFLENQLRTTQQQLKFKDQEYQQDLMELQTLREQNEKLSGELKKIQNTLSNANTLRIQNDQQIRVLKLSLSTREQQLQKLSQQLQNLQSEINLINSQWKFKFKQQQKKLRENEQAQRKLLAQLKNYKNMVENQQNDRNQSQRTLVNQLQFKISQLQSQNSEIKKQLKQLIESSKNEKKILQERFQAKEVELQLKFNQQKDKLIQSLQKSKSFNESKRQELDLLKRNLGQKFMEIETLKSQKLTPQRFFTQYFCGRILNHSTLKQGQWFVKSLERCTKKTIKSTELLYRYDKQNKTPFHNYIDNKPNIVLIVRMANEQIIGGYSKPAFKIKTTVDYQEGYMFGFRNQKVFTLKKEPTNRFNKVNPKPITYDDYYLMWGNSDIRIKSGTNELFSGYATANCCYEEKGNENSVVDDLFMQQERETILLDYELFKVQFENDW